MRRRHADADLGGNLLGCRAEFLSSEAGRCARGIVLAPRCARGERYVPIAETVLGRISRINCSQRIAETNCAGLQDFGGDATMATHGVVPPRTQVFFHP